MTSEELQKPLEAQMNEAGSPAPPAAARLGETVLRDAMLCDA